MKTERRALYEESPDGKEPGGLRGLGIEAVRILVIGCFFWWFELGQNALVKLITGEWGWIYPNNPTHWYDLRTIGLWWFSVFVLGLAHHFWYGPRRVPAWLRWLSFGLFAWGMEWLSGFAWQALNGEPLFIWPGSPFVYVGIAGLPLWIFDTVVYELLVRFRVLVKPLHGRKRHQAHAPHPPRRGSSLV